MVKEKFEPFNIRKSLEDLPKVDFEEVLGSHNPIVLDTNFLFVTFEFKIDIISEIKRVVGKTVSYFIYEGTLKELEAIDTKKNKNKRFLPLISKFLHLYDVKVIKSVNTYVDADILNNVDRRVLIATNDKELRLKLWELETRVLYMRQKSYFEIK